MYPFHDISGSYLTEKDIIKSIDTYYDYAYHVFSVIRDDMYQNDWMNCILTIRPEMERSSSGDAIVFGSYYAGQITIYLYAIMKNTPKNYIPTMIMGVITHELKHAGQLEAAYEAKDTPEYINTVEKSVDWETIQYLSARREYLEEQIGTSINLLAFKELNIKYPVLPVNLYHSISPLEYWNSIIGYMYPETSNVLSDLKNGLLNEYDDLILVIENVNEPANDTFYNTIQYIKQNGIFTFPNKATLELIYRITFADYSIITKLEYSDKYSCQMLVIEYEIEKCNPLIKY